MLAGTTKVPYVCRRLIEGLSATYEVSLKFPSVHQYDLTHPFRSQAHESLAQNPVSFAFLHKANECRRHLKLLHL